MNFRIFSLFFIFSEFLYSIPFGLDFSAAAAVLLLLLCVPTVPTINHILLLLLLKQPSAEEMTQNVLACHRS